MTAGSSLRGKLDLKADKDVLSSEVLLISVQMISKVVVGTLDRARVFVQTADSQMGCFESTQ